MTDPHQPELSATTSIGEGDEVSVFPIVRVIVRAIEAGAFDDIVAVYRSGQMAIDELWDVSAARAEELTGVSWHKFRREVGLAAWGHAHAALRDYEAAGGFEKWFTDQITWAEAHR